MKYWVIGRDKSDSVLSTSNLGDRPPPKSPPMYVTFRLLWMHRAIHIDLRMQNE